MSYPSQLDALHARVAGSGLVASPHGYVLASDRALGTADGTGLGLGSGLATECVPGGPAAEFADGLLVLHRDLLTAAVGHALRHLDGRQSEGAPLLSRPQIQADIAEIATEIRLAATTPGAPDAAEAADDRVRWARHQRLCAAGRRLLHLLGASSMVATGPGRDIYLAELTGNVYLHPGDDDA
jgi:hypothetical protein